MALIYITTKDANEAKSIASTLLSEKIIACANILPESTSIYTWKDKIEEQSENIVILKTQKKLVDIVIKRVKELHSYDCPCIIELKTDKINQDFVKWLENSTILPY